MVTLQDLLGPLAVLLAAVSSVKRPMVGFYFVAACVVLIEAIPLETPILTDRLYVYHWPPALTGKMERPIGLLLLVLVSIVIFRHRRQHQRAMEGGPLLWPFAFLLACVGWGAIHGLAAGGVPKIIVEEVRPFGYLFAAYLLAYNLVSTQQRVRSLFWLIVIGAGLKALQGLYIYLIVLHGHLEGHHEIMAHEESFFFAAVIVLGLLFFLHHRNHPQYDAILQLMPLMAVVVIANQRRIAYVILSAGGLAAWALCFLVRPDNRRRLVALMRIAVPLGVGYLLAFYQDPTFIARPPRAVVSLIYPDPADRISLDSNRYRAIENAALRAAALQHPFLGLGFGRPFAEAGALVDISAWNPNYLYIPHNTIYWVGMRLGIFGFLALWYLLGSILVRGCFIAFRLQDRYLQTIAMFVVATCIMELLVAYADYQLYFHRSVLYLGLLAGVLMRLPDCDADRTGEPERP